jgi:ketosteroid isomerase-like protein
MSAGDESNVITQEARRMRAMLDRDLDVLETILDPDLVYGHGSGQADTRQSYCDRLRRGETVYRSGRSEVRQLIDLGKTVLMFARISMDAVIDGRTKAIDSSVLLVWREVTGSWRLIAHHPTVLGANAVSTFPPEAAHQLT